MKKCIIIGAGTYGQVYAKYLSEHYLIIGYVDDDSSLENSEIAGYNVIGDVSSLFNNPIYEPNLISIFVPLGNNSIRNRLLNRLAEFGYKTPSFIHKSTLIDSSVIIEEPVYILPGTNIMPYSKISKNVMISMGVNIAHHVIVESGCFFSQGTNVGASIIIGELTYMGIASTLMTGVKNIGKNSLIGAGAVVIKDIPDNVIVAGVPAKILKINKSID